MYSISPAIIFFAFNKVFLQGIINGIERMRAYAVYQIIRYLLIFICLIFCLFLSLEGKYLPVIFVFSESFLFLILFIDISIKISMVAFKRMVQMEQDSCLFWP